MFRKIFFFYLTVYSLLGTSITKAQIDNSFFYDHYPLGEEHNQNLYLNLDILGYLKNNEYYGQIVNGYTHFGYQLRPELSYHPLKNFRIGIGGYFQRDFGDQDFYQILPTFSLKYQIDSLIIIFGTLEGALTHQIIEPMFDFERIIDDRIEEGLQIKWKKKSFNLDLWLDWQNAIRSDEDDQEELTGGLNINPHIYRSDQTSFSLILQSIVKHLGGQKIDSDIEEILVINNSLGFSYYKQYGISCIIESIRSENLFLTSHWSTNAYGLNYRSGHGVFLNMDATIQNFNIIGSYWYGYNFFSPTGGPLYLSVAQDYPETGYLETKRELFFLRFMWHKKFDGGLSLGIRFEPFYDIRNNFMDHSEALYIRYSGDFRITSLRK